MSGQKWLVFLTLYASARQQIQWGSLCKALNLILLFASYLPFKPQLTLTTRQLKCIKFLGVKTFTTPPKDLKRESLSQKRWTPPEFSFCRRPTNTSLHHYHNNFGSFVISLVGCNLWRLWYFDLCCIFLLLHCPMSKENSKSKNVAIWPIAERWQDSLHPLS